MPVVLGALEGVAGLVVLIVAMKRVLKVQQSKEVLSFESRVLS
jgi:hypothetical protein